MHPKASEAVILMFRPRMFIFCVLMFAFAPPKALIGQSLHFCRSHTQEGKPIGSQDTFELKKAGQNIEFLFDQGGNITSPKIYFFVDRWTNGRFDEYDTKSSTLVNSSNWTAVQYSFNQAGAYRVQVLDADKKLLISKQLGVSIIENKDSPNYFEGTAMVLCSKAPDGIPSDSLKEVPLGEYVVLLRHTRPIETERVLVDIWTGPDDKSLDFSEHIELATDPDWTYLQFKYRIQQTGHLSLRFYTANDVYIGHMEIKSITP
jgi:hypothetical protein